MEKTTSRRTMIRSGKPLVHPEGRPSRDVARPALKTAYNAILAASFALEAGRLDRATEILNSALKDLNSNHTREIQEKVLGI